MGKYFFWDFTSASAKSNLAKVGGILAQIKIFFYKNVSLYGQVSGSRLVLHLKKNSILSPRATFVFLFTAAKKKIRYPR